MPILAARAQSHGGVVLRWPAPVEELGAGQATIIQDTQGRIIRFIADDLRHTDREDRPDHPIRLAHAVRNSGNVAVALSFYEQAFDFRLSDRTGIMAFIRIACEGWGDHHSIALADADNDCLNHIAFVMPTVEAVMRGGGRMKDAGYPIEWGPGRHGPGDNAFNYFVGPADFVIEYTAEVEQISESYIARGPADWKWPTGRVDQWGISQLPSARLRRAQRAIVFDGQYLEYR